MYWVNSKATLTVYVTALILISENLNIHRCYVDRGLKLESKMLLWVALLQLAFPKRHSQLKTKMLMSSLTSVQESCDTGLQGKQQAEEKDGKYCVCFTYFLLCHNTVFFSLITHAAFLFVCDDQTNPRSALSHGDSDPFKFRWLIPLSALQVRLGNTAGKEAALNHSQSTSTKSFCSFILLHTPLSSFCMPTHPLVWHFYSAPLPSYLLLNS